MSVQVRFLVQFVFKNLVPPVLRGDTPKIYGAWSAQINYHHCLFTGE
jgi:hypothetical protein